jgi:UDP-glucose 4-epimerase
MSGLARSIFVTGAGGYLGTELLRRLSQSDRRYNITAFDRRTIPLSEQLPGIDYKFGDVRDSSLRDILKEGYADTVVHLASIVSPGGPDRREFERSVDVEGTENVLNACVNARTQHIIVTSSGAAYGYHADNPVPLRESDPLRGNPEFPYADHKRIIEERLAEYRVLHPQLKQLVLRPGTVLGERTDNQITRLFGGPCIVGIAGYKTPFVFIWDQDVVNIISQGIEKCTTGVFNLAGNGSLTLREIASITGKPYLPIPPFLFRAALGLLQKIGWSSAGPEQLVFLQYRPVLANDKLRLEFPYSPMMTSLETFKYYWEHRGNHPHA